MSTLLSALPILIVLACLLVLRLSAAKSGALGFCAAALIYYFYFRSGVLGLGISTAKGLCLASFVVFIIWGAILLYNLVRESGALEVINRNIQIVVREKFVQFLLLSWIFSAFLQGIAGFGVPVAVVTPILIGLGFDPAISAAAVLIGHSWSISFGSMGSSIYAVDLVTEADIGGIVAYMALFGTVAMALTGLAVCHIYGGFRALGRGLPYVGILTCVMGGTLFLTAKMNMTSLMGLITGLSGTAALFLLGRRASRGGEGGSGGQRLYRSKINFAEALLPYMLIVVLSLLFFLLKPEASLSFDFPGYVTPGGRAVAAEEGYVTFNLLKYPCTIMLAASLISGCLYGKRGVLDRKAVKKIAKDTVKKCAPTTLTIVCLLCTAVLLMDSGMIQIIADGLVGAAGERYPLISPFIGTLGAFVTGSNTNSNIIFGNLQETAAEALGLSTAAICALQSIGASVGGAVGPTTVSMGAAAAQIQGQESKIYGRTLAPVLLIALVLGIAGLLFI